LLVNFFFEKLDKYFISSLALDEASY